MVTSSVLLGRCVPSEVTPIYPPKYGCARHVAGTTFQRFAAADTSMVLAIAPVAQGLPRRAYRVRGEQRSRARSIAFGRSASKNCGANGGGSTTLNRRGSVATWLSPPRLVQQSLRRTRPAFASSLERAAFNRKRLMFRGTSLIWLQWTSRLRYTLWIWTGRWRKGLRSSPASTR
jgi:hypothetical protein